MAGIPSKKLRIAAFAIYTAVIVALTLLKSFFRIGYLWKPEKQRFRGVKPIPLDDLWEAIGGDSWWVPGFEYLGNICLFIPFGVLLVVLIDGPAAARGDAPPGRMVRTLRRSIIPRRILPQATLIAFATSLSMEVLQYVFAVGRSDVDDLIMNTLGGFIGANIALLLGRRMYRVWTWLALVVGAAFAVAAGLGERFGDPDKVVDYS